MHGCTALLKVLLQNTDLMRSNVFDLLVKQNRLKYEGIGHYTVNSVEKTICSTVVQFVSYNRAIVFLK